MNILNDFAVGHLHFDDSSSSSSDGHSGSLDGWRFVSNVDKQDSFDYSL